MLKASAMAVPIIATLPSGAALANASSSQCVIKDLDQTGGNTNLEGFKSEIDQFVRVPATIRTVIKGGRNNVIGRVYQVKDKLYDTSGKPVYLDAQGKLFVDEDHTTAFLKRGATLGDSEGTAFAVQVYVPWSDATGEVDVHAPTTVAKVMPGYWPENKLTDDPNMALTASCLCSVNPNSPAC